MITIMITWNHVIDYNRLPITITPSLMIRFMIHTNSIIDTIMYWHHCSEPLFSLELNVREQIDVL